MPSVLSTLMLVSPGDAWEKIETGGPAAVPLVATVELSMMPVPGRFAPESQTLPILIGAPTILLWLSGDVTWMVVSPTLTGAARVLYPPEVARSWPAFPISIM